MGKKKQYKCFYCQLHVPAEEAICEEKEGTRTKKNKDNTEEKVPHITRKYFHRYCKEKQDNHRHYRNATEKFLINLYGGIVLPSGLVIAHDKIAKLTNSSYEHIYKAYQRCEQTIRYRLQNKNDFKSIQHKMFYGLKVMEGELNEVYEQEQKRKENEEIIARPITNEAAEVLDGNWDVGNRQYMSTDALDISDFL